MPQWSDPIEGQGSAHDFSAEPEFVGQYIGTDTIDVRDNFGGGYREAKIHRFDTPNGTVDVWDSADLGPKIKKVQIGTVTKITYVRTDTIEARDGGEPRQVKRFTVQIDEATVPPVHASTDDIPF